MKGVKMKNKIKYALLLLIVLLLCYTIKGSYAVYNSIADGKIKDENNSREIIAKFIVNNQLSDSINFEISDLSPGDTKTFNFSVSNTINTTHSDVSIKYKINIHSYSLPLTYILTQDQNTNNLLTCSGEVDISCESSELIMNYNDNTIKNFTLKVTLPEANTNEEAFDYTYANNIDIVTLTIDSWQIIS